MARNALGRQGSRHVIRCSSAHHRDRTTPAPRVPPQAASLPKDAPPAQASQSLGFGSALETDFLEWQVAHIFVPLGASHRSPGPLTQSPIRIQQVRQIPLAYHTLLTNT